MLSTDMSAKHISWRDCVAGLGPRLALCCIAGLLFFCNYEAARLWVRLLLQALASLWPAPPPSDGSRGWRNTWRGVHGAYLAWGEPPALAR